MVSDASATSSVSNPKPVRRVDKIYAKQAAAWAVWLKWPAHQLISSSAATTCLLISLLFLLNNLTATCLPTQQKQHQHKHPQKFYQNLSHPLERQLNQQQQQQQTSTTILPSTTLSPSTSTLLADEENGDFSQQIDNSIIESDFTKRVLAQYVFDEFYNRNLSDSLSDANQTGQLWLSGSSGLSQSDSSNGTSSISERFNQAQVVGGTINTAVGRVLLGQARPYFGDVFFWFQTVYWPYHCILCLAICTLGIFANVTNIIVLTRPNMITAVNTILCAIAFSDLIVNVSNIPYLIHELGDNTSISSFYTFQWASYILFHAHTTVTAHTISIWLTCVLATWRYFVVCRSQPSNQRNWTVGLAKRTIVGVFLLVPLFCIPNYLSFAIVSEEPEPNQIIYKVDFSLLANDSQFIKTFHFWIFSCLTKLVPCVLLTFFTTVLIRKLLNAHERRLRLTSFGNTQSKDTDKSKVTVSNSNQGADVPITETGRVIVNGVGRAGVIFDSHDTQDIVHLNNENHSTIRQLITGTSQANSSESGMGNHDRSKSKRESSCANDTELIATSCESSASGGEQVTSSQQGLMLSRLIVESVTSATNITTVSTSTVHAKMLDSCDMIERNIPINFSKSPSKLNESPRSASTCGALELYSGKSRELNLDESQPLVMLSMTASQNFAGSSNNLMGNRTSLTQSDFADLSLNTVREIGCRELEKRSSESRIGARGRSVGSSTLAPFQMVKIQAAQRQLSQNETTTRLLIAVMIVFLICEFPAGILAALCAILGPDFFENVYQPIGILTDLLALINSSVNFILYCFMSTQFRITFYRVVLHCPAPNGSQNAH